MAMIVITDENRCVIRGRLHTDTSDSIKSIEQVLDDFLKNCFLFQVISLTINEQPYIIKILITKGFFRSVGLQNPCVFTKVLKTLETPYWKYTSAHLCMRIFYRKKGLLFIAAFDACRTYHISKYFIDNDGCVVFDFRSFGDNADLFIIFDKMFYGELTLKFLLTFKQYKSLSNLMNLTELPSSSYDVVLRRIPCRNEYEAKPFRCDKPVVLIPSIF